MAVTLRWPPSLDADPSQYEVQSAPALAGPFTQLALIAHSLVGANYDAPSGTFFYAHSAGTLSTWYRLRTQDTAGSWSGFGQPFQVGQTSAYLQTTDLQVVQMALGNVGVTTTVQSLLAPTTKAEVLASLWYSRTRDRLLRKAKPSWSRRRADLELLVDHARDGWAHVYSLPTDCLWPLGFTCDGWRAGVSALGTRSRYSMEANNLATGRVLCTDVENACLVYVSQVTDPSLWSPEFLDAVTWALASRIAIPEVVKVEAAQLAGQMAAQTLSEAVAMDANEEDPDPPPDPDFISCRSW